MSDATSAASVVIPAGRRAHGTLRVPPSKSFSHRYLVLALLARAPLRIDNLLQAEDLDLFRSALAELGYRVSESPGSVTIGPPEREVARGDIYCGNAGTMFRLLTAALTTVPGRWRLSGSPRLRERPVGALVSCLRTLGAEIAYVDEDGFAPLDILGGSLRGGAADLDAGESSQYLSAVLLAASRAERPVSLRVTALASSPYLAITLEVLRRFGVAVAASDGGARFEVRPGFGDLPRHVEVEGDYSAATYPAVAALVTGGSVLLEGLREGSPQGDRRFFDLLRQAGARVAWKREGLEVVAGGEVLDALAVDMCDMPDQVPTLAALAPFLRGSTIISNVAHLRIKESDRLRATATELRRLGVPVVERDDGLTIEGVWFRQSPPRQPVAVETYDDHRIAMSMALVGLRRPGVSILRPAVVRKSYPNFWRDLDTLIGSS